MADMALKSSRTWNQQGGVDFARPTLHAGCKPPSPAPKPNTYYTEPASVNSVNFSSTRLKPNAKRPKASRNPSARHGSPLGDESLRNTQYPVLETNLNCGPARKRKLRI